MTNDEAYKLINGGAGNEPDSADNSESRTPAEAPKDSTATAVKEPEAKPAVNPTDPQPKAPETKGEAKTGDEKQQPHTQEPQPKDKDFYTADRAKHAFSKQRDFYTRQIRAKDARIAELEEAIEKYKGLKPEAFVDKVTGKQDDSAYHQYLTDMSVSQQRLDDLKEERQSLQDSLDDNDFDERIDDELGKDADEFRKLCGKVIDNDGTTLLEGFKFWLKGNDPDNIVTGRIKASKNGVKLMQRLMKDKASRDALLNTTTAYQAERLLDRMEEELGTAKAAAPVDKTPLATIMKGLREKNPPKKAMKPTGSAFGGENKGGKVERNNDYFASLL